MFKIGLTLGKFLPPHKGHEYMIDFASRMCETLIVIVGGQETDVIPVTTRYTWLVEHYAASPHIKFVIDKEDVPVTTVDENGTCTDPKFWDHWRKKLNRIEPNIDAIFTSDWYGQRTAKEIGVAWIPVDPGRKIIPISATEIRNYPMMFFHYIIEEARPHYVKTVAIVGPESCGKSILARELALLFDTVFVPEYGRTLSAARNNNLIEEDFNIIADGQEAITEILIKKANRVLFQDTELLVTYLFGKIYLNMDLTYLKDRAAAQNFDLYVLLAPSVKWVDDGLRILSDNKDRWTFFEDLKALLNELNKPYIIVDDDSFVKRTDAVKVALSKLGVKT